MHMAALLEYLKGVIKCVTRDPFSRVFCMISFILPNHFNYYCYVFAIDKADLVKDIT